MTAKLYVFAGAPKCGSTWLYDQFRRHPEITAAQIKDPFYFDRHYDRGDDWYWSLFGVRGPSAPDGVYAELSHDYLFEPAFWPRCRTTAAGRAAEPFVHLVLRDPVERLLSAMRYQISFEGRRRPGAIPQAYPKMVAESQYSAHVARMLDAVPAGNLRVDLFEELVAEPGERIGEICTWLGVAAGGDWLDATPSRARRDPRRPGLAMRARRTGALLRRAGLVRVVERAKSSAAAERFLFRPAETTGADGLADVDTEELADLFVADVATLSRLLDRELCSAWNVAR